MSELLERVRAATGNVDPVTAGGWLNTFGPWECETPEWHLFCRAANGDLNSALALVERVLPAHGWVVGKRYNGPGFFAEIYDADFLHEVVGRADAATAPLALIAALLAALNQTETEA